MPIIQYVKCTICGRAIELLNQKDWLTLWKGQLPTFGSKVGHEGVMIFCGIDQNFPELGGKTYHICSHTCLYKVMNEQLSTGLLADANTFELNPQAVEEYGATNVVPMGSTNIVSEAGDLLQDEDPGVRLIRLAQGQAARSLSGGGVHRKSERKEF